MHRRLSLLAASLLLAPALVAIPGGMTPAAEAQTPASPTLCSGIQLQNTTNTTANVTLNFIRVSTSTNPVDPSQRGQIVTTIGGAGSPDGTLGPNVSRSYPLFGPRFSGIIADGMYSVVVNADQPLNALVNQQTCTGSSPFVLSSFRGSGSADVGTNLFLPFILSRAFPQLFSSYIAIQNAGNAPATVQIAFFPQGSSTASQTVAVTAPTTQGGLGSNLQVGETWYLNLATGPIQALFPSGFVGSARVTSNQNVAAVANYAPNDFTQLLSYNALLNPAAAIVAPQVVRNAFPQQYNSGFTIVNATTGDVQLQVIFNGVIVSPAPNAGTPITNLIYTPNATDFPAAPFLGTNGTLPGSGTFVMNMNRVSSLPDGFNGTATVRTVGGQAALVAIANITSPPATSQGDAMTMISNQAGPGGLASTLFMPQQTKNFFGYTTGFQVANPTGSDVVVQITYNRDDGSSLGPYFVRIPAGQSLTNFLGSASFPYGTSVGSPGVVGSNTFANPIPDNWNGGVVVIVNGGTASIVGQGNFAGTVTGDALSIYNAFPG